VSIDQIRPNTDGQGKQQLLPASKNGRAIEGLCDNTLYCNNQKLIKHAA
jgi:hypothetical protein